MLGTAEVLGTAILLDKRELSPGEEGLVEISLKETLVPRLYDRVILRLPGPQLTIGGGPILDWARPDKRTSRTELIPLLTGRKTPELPGLILAEIKKLRSAKHAEVLKSSHFSQEEIQEAMEQLLKDGKLLRQGGLLFHHDIWQQTSRRIAELLESYHRQCPFKPGLKTAELAGRLKADPEFMQLMVDSLQSEGTLAVKQGYVALASHQPKLTPALERKMQILNQILEDKTSAPPGREELIRQDRDYELVVTYLIQTGRLVELRDGLLLRTSDFQAIQHKVRTLIAEKKQVSVSDVREYLQTSRKYAVPILEKLDQLGITKRKGDYRILNDA
jgi:selenocysteine-specific elongation factor